jgi:hypothetical protein
MASNSPVPTVNAPDPSLLRPCCPECGQRTEPWLPGLVDVSRRLLRNFYICPEAHAHLAEIDADADHDAVAQASENPHVPSTVFWWAHPHAAGAA